MGQSYSQDQPPPGTGEKPKTPPATPLDQSTSQLPPFGPLPLERTLSLQSQPESIHQPVTSFSSDPLVQYLETKLPTFELYTLRCLFDKLKEGEGEGAYIPRAKFSEFLELPPSISDILYDAFVNARKHHVLITYWIDGIGGIEGAHRQIEEITPTILRGLRLNLYRSNTNISDYAGTVNELGVPTTYKEGEAENEDEEVVIPVEPPPMSVCFPSLMEAIAVAALPLQNPKSASHRTRSLESVKGEFRRSSTISSHATGVTMDTKYEDEQNHRIALFFRMFGRVEERIVPGSDGQPSASLRVPYMIREDVVKMVRCLMWLGVRGVLEVKKRPTLRMKKSQEGAKPEDEEEEVKVDDSIVNNVVDSIFAYRIQSTAESTPDDDLFAALGVTAEDFSALGIQDKKPQPGIPPPPKLSPDEPPRLYFKDFWGWQVRNSPRFFKILEIFVHDRFLTMMSDLSRSSPSLLSQSLPSDPSFRPPSFPPAPRRRRSSAASVSPVSQLYQFLPLLNVKHSSSSPSKSNSKDQPSSILQALTPEYIWLLAASLMYSPAATPGLKHGDRSVSPQRSRNRERMSSTQVGMLEEIRKLMGQMPTWTLLYDSELHGTSTSRLEYKVFKYNGPTLLLIDAYSENESSSCLFAAFVPSEWSQSKTSFFGNEEALLIALYPWFEVFPTFDDLERRARHASSAFIPEPPSSASPLLSHKTSHDQIELGNIAYRRILMSSTSPYRNYIYYHPSLGIGFGGPSPKESSHNAATPFRLFVNTALTGGHWRMQPLQTSFDTSILDGTYLPSVVHRGEVVVRKFEASCVYTLGLGLDSALDAQKQEQEFEGREAERRKGGGWSRKANKGDDEIDKLILEWAGVHSFYDGP